MGQPPQHIGSSMQLYAKALVVLGLCIGLAACSLPRGAALQSEVVKAADKDAPGFSVYPVTRTFLAQLGAWPSAGQSKTQTWVPRQKGPIGRVILPGDRIQLSIWDSDENSLLAAPGSKVAKLQEMNVASNGNIFVPYVGAVRISGMSDQSARETVQDALGAVSPSAQVQLGSSPGARHSVNLVSGVNSPGAIPLEDRDMTVLAAITRGGGVSKDFTNPEVRLLRGDQTFATPLDRLFRSPRLDTTVRSGDKIIVAETDRYFLALGASGTEDLITFPRDEVTALEAVSLMGGIADSRADPKGVLVLREYPASAVREDAAQGPGQDRVVFVLDLTSADGLFSAGKFHIEPRDLVYATESPLTNARTVLGLIGAAFGVAQQLEN